MKHWKQKIVTEHLNQNPSLRLEASCTSCHGDGFIWYEFPTPDIPDGGLPCDLCNKDWEEGPIQSIEWEERREKGECFSNLMLTG